MQIFLLKENSAKIDTVIKIFISEIAGPNIIDSGTKDNKKKYSWFTI